MAVAVAVDVMTVAAVVAPGYLCPRSCWTVLRWGCLSCTLVLRKVGSVWEVADGCYLVQDIPAMPNSLELVPIPSELAMAQASWTSL
jgi:hypothetical protein